MPRLSIVIVTFNSANEIEACLASLAAPPAAVDHDILVVDNHSSDGTVAGIRTRWPRVTVVDAGGNLGFAAATNLGIRRTSSDLVLLLNPDTLVPAGAIDALVGALDARPDAAVAGPRLVDAAGRAELSFGRMIGPLTELRQKLLVAGQDRGTPLISGIVERVTRQPHAVDWVSGACMLVRRRDAEAVGLLDERFFMYAEDVDFCAAIRAQGRTVWFIPAAEVVHLRGRSASSRRRATEAAYRRSQLAFYAKHHPRLLPFLRAYLKVRGRLPDTTIDPRSSSDEQF